MVLKGGVNQLVLGLTIIVFPYITSMSSRYLYLGPYINIENESLVFGIQTDVLAPGTTSEFMRYVFPPDNTAFLKAVTVCIRIQILQFRELVPYFSYAYSDKYDNALLMYQKGSKLEFYYNDNQESSGLHLTVDDTIGAWHHYCLVVDFPHYEVFADGRLLKDGIIKGTNYIIPLNGTLFIGQEQDKLGGGTDPAQTISGYVAQMNIWNYTLLEKNIQDIALCRRHSRGNILSSDETDFENQGVGSTSVSVETLCAKNSEFVIVPLPKYLPEAESFCHLVNTTVFVPSNDELNSELHNTSHQFRSACDNKSYRRLYLGSKYDTERKTWQSIGNREPLRYTAWAPGEPNSVSGDSCIVLRNDMPKWGDIACSDQLCFSCEKTPQDYIFLRGLCKSNEHEIRFIMDGYVNTRPYFRGYYGMAMFFSDDNKWIFKDTMKNITIARMSFRQENDYPIGRSNWTIISPFCGHSPPEPIELGLSKCLDSEYMCADGSCVDRHVRCNLKEDCSDGSDELKCEVVQRTGRYASHRPPPGETFEDQLMIFPHVHMVRFSKIDDINQAFYMEYEVMLMWTDRNLLFKNVKNEAAKNKLSSREVDSIWTPEIDFLNVNDGLLKKLKSGVYARKTGMADPPHFNDVKMDTIFQPESISLVKKTFYSASFSCNFRLFKYPFDTQLCAILIKLDSADTSVITFSNATVEYSGLINLPKYTVQNLTIKLIEKAGYSVIEVNFELDRRWSLLVLTIFLPTILLIGIGYITLYVKLSLLQVRAIMTLTTLLVLYTLFNQVSSNLPDTAYIKMIDVWFFFCIFFIFSIIIVHVVVEYLPEKSTDTKNITKVSPIIRKEMSVANTRKIRLTATRLMKISRYFLYPAIFLIFKLVYWLSIIGMQN